ncbi:MAG TPA: molybdate ABC transporter substrate-binding protein [Burkholderiales bacterium]|nr:molybdate ABC transporter substrate-binding protein [Burkholderiales bacterium]
MRRTQWFCRIVLRGTSIAGMLIALAFPLAAFAQNLTVFAAASLKDALDEVNAAYRRRGAERIAIAYAGSAALAKQIENGAPADIFISADRNWMDDIEKRHYVKDAARVDLLRNEIVLIAPAASTVTLKIERGFPLVQALGNGRLAMADPDSVPAGRYGKAALESLGVWPSVAGRIARAENVRAALLFVSRGEAPLGIVYRTDALADRRVRIVAVFPPDTHPPIVYPAALLTSGKGAGAAAFYDYLRSPAASEIFRKHGFVPY